MEVRKNEEVICNQCGRKLSVQNGILTEGCVSVDTTFGYFSEKDGVRHRFDLCENCYDKMIRAFLVPVTEEKVTELL